MQKRGSVLSAILGSHIRAWPPAEIRMRRQRRLPATGSTCSQVPWSDDRSICVRLAELARPRPLYTIPLPPVAATTIPDVPSSPDLFWTMRGAVVSDGATLQAPAGSDRLTTQETEAVSAQLAVRSLTIWNRTAVLRRSASARARLRPLIVISAALR